MEGRAGMMDKRVELAGVASHDSIEESGWIVERFQVVASTLSRGFEKKGMRNSNC
jgi:hypothetical protein